MAQVLFYHLVSQPLEQRLPALLHKALGRGWRVVVRGTDPARMEQLDEQLWLGPEEGFLPHGLAGGPHDADQPVLLTSAPGLPPGVSCLMAVDGAGIDAAEVAGLAWAGLLFDGNDPARLEAARAQWRLLTAAGHAAQYWSDATGRWEKKAESGG